MALKHVIQERETIHTFLPAGPVSREEFQDEEHIQERERPFETRRKMRAPQNNKRVISLQEVLTG